MTIVRWALVIPTAIAAWYAVFIVGIFAYGFINSLCPAEDLVSGFCSNRAISVLLDVTMHVFVAVAAVAVMSSVVSVAPSHKSPVAWLTLLAGTAVAAYAGFTVGDWTLFLAAVVGGCVALAIILKRTREVSREP